MNPVYENIWGDESVGYRITPSWLIPPQLISSIIIGYLCLGIENDKEKIVNLDLKKFIIKLVGGKK